MKLVSKNSLPLAGIITIVISFLVMVGWVLDIGLLKSVFPGFISMKFNTAVCFLLTGIALFMMGKRQGARACVVCITVVILISLLTLSEYIFAVDLGIDEVFFKDDAGAAYTLYPGRPSALTALNFLLISFVLFNINSIKTFFLTWVALSLCMLVASISTISYFFGNPELISIPSLTVLALHTAFLFLIICSGIYYSDFFRRTALSLQRRMLGGFLVIAFVLLVVVYLDNKVDKQLGKTADLMSTNTESIILVDDINSSLTRMESSVRGYLLVRDSSLLMPAMEGKNKLAVYLNQLKTRITQEPLQLARMDTLSALLNTRFNLLDSSLLLAEKQVSLQKNLRDILLRTPVLMNRIVTLLHDVKVREQQLMKEMQHKNEASKSRANQAILFLGFTILSIFLALIQFIFRNIKALSMAETEALQLAATLEKKVNERTAQLYEANAQLHKLTAHLHDAREEEQRVLSREVNDEIGQLASAAKMDIDWLALHNKDADPMVSKRIGNASRILQTLINDVRTFASSLRPVMIDELGLNASIRWLCDQFIKNNGTVCTYKEAIDDTQFSLPLRTALFRICQESLENVFAHANATRVEVGLQEIPGGIVLVITDNGIGFNTDEVTEKIGIIEIRERVRSVNGTIEIETGPGKGTVIRVTVPVS